MLWYVTEGAKKLSTLSMKIHMSRMKTLLDKH